MFGANDLLALDTAQWVNTSFIAYDTGVASGKGEIGWSDVFELRYGNL